MNKLPVGQIIRQAYAFTFGEIGTVIGLTWIPTLINTVATYFMLRSYALVLESFETGAPPTDGQALLPFPLAILSLFLVGMTGVALSRQVLGLRKGPAIAHVEFGAETLRVFAGFIGVYLLTMLFVMTLMVAVGALAAIAGSIASPVAAALAAVGALAGIFALIYGVIRLGYLLIPSVVVDGHFGLTRSWQLTRGNVLRIVAILFATLMPLILVSDIATALVMGPLPQPPAVQPTDMAGVIHIWAEQLRTTLPHLPALMGVSLVLAPLGYSLLFTPAALAYRILSGKAIVQAHDS
jgi:hypothetical protein